MTYLYCLVRSSRKPALRRVRSGLPGAGVVRALDAGGGLWLIVAHVDEADYGEAAIAAGLSRFDWVSPRAVGHEAVIERFLSSAAVLPMQLFTIFTSDERALDHVRRDRARIERILARLEGKHEWGVRLTWDQAAAREAVEQRHGPVRRGDGDAAGRAYLARKRDLLDVNRAQRASARRAATQLFREMSKHASEARRRTATERAVPGSRVLLDAAYLVPAARGAAFRAALRRRARALESSGVAIAVTGPWPPYNFISSSRGGAGRRTRGR